MPDLYYIMMLFLFLQMQVDLFLYIMTRFDLILFLFSRFDAIVISSEVGYEKPDSGIFKAALGMKFDMFDPLID